METILGILQWYGDFSNDPIKVAMMAAGIGFMSSLISFWVQKKGETMGCLDMVFVLFIAAIQIVNLGSVVASIFFNGSPAAILVWLMATASGGITGYFVSELLPN